MVNLEAMPQTDVRRALAHVAHHSGYIRVESLITRAHESGGSGSDPACDLPADGRLLRTLLDGSTAPFGTQILQRQVAGSQRSELVAERQGGAFLHDVL